MKFETLPDKKKRLKVALIVVGVILVIGITAFTLTRAKYQYTDSIPLIRATNISYSFSDLEIVSIKIKNGSSYSEVDEVPSSGYKLVTSETVCKDKSGNTVDTTFEYVDGKVKVGVTKKGSKCTLVFEENNDITILATLNTVATDTFPAKSGSYMPKSINCTGDVDAKFDLVDWQVEVDATKGTTCVVDFEAKKNQAFNTYLKNKVCASSVTDEAGAKDCLVNENGYRYEGSDPNNYVLFNDELWRVIGVFDIKESGATTTSSLVKLIRDDTLDSLAWHSSANNTWSSAKLQTTLNNGYLNATDATCNAYSTSVTKTCKFSESGIKSGARNKIQAVQWNIGKTTVGTAEAMYSAETASTWSGSVGLMSASDYGYATYASTNCDRNKSTGSYNTTDCAGKNWLYKDGYQWTMTGYSSKNNNIALYVHNDRNSGGFGSIITTNVTYGYGVRPSIYLKSTIKILGGLGTKELPYVIE